MSRHLLQHLTQTFSPEQTQQREGRATRLPHNRLLLLNVGKTGIQNGGENGLAELEPITKGKHFLRVGGITGARAESLDKCNFYSSNSCIRRISGTY